MGGWEEPWRSVLARLRGGVEVSGLVRAGDSPFPFANFCSGERRFTTSSRRICSARASPQGNSRWTITLGETKRSQSERMSSLSAGFARKRAAAWAVSFTRMRRVRRRAKAVAGTSFARRRVGAWEANVD